MKGAPIIVVLLGILAVIVLLCTHTVKEWEQALVLQFGEAKRVENAWGSDPQAGLKFKLPYETVVTIDRRNLEVDIKTVELVASDQERLVVDAFVRYRIVDGIRFYEALQSEEGAKIQLDSIMDSTLRDVLGRVDRPEIIAGRRAELMAEIQQVSNNVVKDKDFGIEIIDVRIKRADLPPNNTEQVLNIRGEGDQERNAIYAEAYNQDAEFFAFYRSMEAYKTGLGTGTTYVLSPDSDFLGYLSNQRGPRR